MKDLSDKVKAICKANYKNNCGQCPIRPACCKGISPGYESLYRWIDDVNELAETQK